MIEPATELVVQVTEASGGGTALVFRQRAGVAVAEEVRQAALQALERGGDILVDCTAAEHLDGSIFQILLALRKALRSRGQELHLSGVSPSLSRYAWLSGLLEKPA